MVQKSQNKHGLTIQKFRRAFYVRIVLVVLAIFLLAYSGFMAYERYSATSGTAQLPSPGDVITYDISQPEEKQPNVSEYSVPAEQPKNISIPKINAEGIIQKVGVTDKAAIAAPSNIYFAGWFTQSSSPGEEGLSVIVGHVSGRYEDGIFKKLSQLETGDRYTVEYGDGRISSFSVVELKTLPEKESVPFLLEKRQDIDSQLNLITCGGKFNKQTNTYEDRVIVVSKRVD